MCKINATIIEIKIINAPINAVAGKITKKAEAISYIPVRYCEVVPPMFPKMPVASSGEVRNFVTPKKRNAMNKII